MGDVIDLKQRRAARPGWRPGQAGARASSSADDEAAVIHVGRCQGCDEMARIEEGLCRSCVRSPFRRSRFGKLAYRCRTDPVFHRVAYEQIEDPERRQAFVEHFGLPLPVSQLKKIIEQRKATAGEASTSEPEE